MLSISFVGLVQHHGLHRAEVQAALVGQVEQTAGGADDHLNALAQAAQLQLVRLAAVNGKYGNAASLAVALDGFGHLDGQLAGRGQHQGLDALLPGGDPLQQRQPKGGGLAGAGLGLADEVAASKQQRDGRLLNGGGVGESEFGDGLHQIRVQAKIGKGLCCHQATP